MTKIVIVGGGFGGLMTVLNLEKKFRHDKNISLTLVDQRDYHLFTPNLVEVATAEEELSSVSQIKKSTTVSFLEIFAKKKIRFIKGKINSVDQGKKQLLIGNKQIGYDYLILSLGSQSRIAEVSGARDFANTLNDLPDALRIRNKIEFLIQSHRYDAKKPEVRLVVAGGGYVGLEFAAAAKGMVDFLAWKNQYPREKVEIEVIGSGSKLIPNFNSQMSDDAYYRLKELGISVRLSSRISGVSEHFVELIGGEKVKYDCLVWAAGVMGKEINFTNAVEAGRRGFLPINEFFQLRGYHEIFVLGDLALVADKHQQAVPKSAQDAIDQAGYLAYALPFILKNQKPPFSYVPKKHGFIVSLGGKWAIFSYGGFYFTGWLAYLADMAAHLGYYAGIVGWFKAVKYVIFQMEIYSRKD